MKCDRIMDGLKEGEASSPSWNTMVTMSFPMCLFLSTYREAGRWEIRRKGRHDAHMTLVNKLYGVWLLSAFKVHQSEGSQGPPDDSIPVCSHVRAGKCIYAAL